MRHIEKEVMLKMLDQHWREHLAAMDYLRQGIHLRGYAQKDYRFEYKREAFELFAAMLDRVKFETVSFLAKIEIRTAEEIEREEEERRERLMRALQAQHAEAQSVFTAPEIPAEPLPGSSEVTYAQVPGVALPGALMGGAGSRTLPHPIPEAQGTFVRGDRKVGRNELCPCGSGKKFKHCHGTLTSVE
jgi:preprotein translocase subunit SecA